MLTCVDDLCPVTESRCAYDSDAVNFLASSIDLSTSPITFLQMEGMCTQKDINTP